MDDTINLMDNSIKTKREGFPGQRLMRLPMATVETCKATPIVCRLYPNSIGHFPHAPGHLVRRPAGIDNHMILLCTTGFGFLEIKGTRHCISTGQIALIPKNTPHHYGSSSQQPWGKVWTHFNGHDAQHLMDLLQLAPNNPVYTLQSTQEAISRFETLYYWSMKPHTEETLLQIHGALMNWVLCVLRNRGHANDRNQKQNEGILQAIHRIQTECHLELKPSILAKDCGMSEATFYRSFKKVTDCTPLNFLVRVRMQKACQLLDLSNDSINEVGQAVGYEDPYYFSRIFSKMMGMSPSHYRNSDMGSSTQSRNTYTSSLAKSS